MHTQEKIIFFFSVSMIINNVEPAKINYLFEFKKYGDNKQAHCEFMANNVNS